MTRSVCLVPHAPPQAGGPLVQLLAEHQVQPGELGCDLAGAEVQVRAGAVRDHLAGAGEHVVVRGPTPGALLAQEVRAVDHFIEPVAPRRPRSWPQQPSRRRASAAAAGSPRVPRTPCGCRRGSSARSAETSGCGQGLPLSSAAWAASYPQGASAARCQTPSDAGRTVSRSREPCSDCGQRGGVSAGAPGSAKRMRRVPAALQRRRCRRVLPCWILLSCVRV